MKRTRCWVSALVLALAWLGCAPGAPKGPAFVPATHPGPSEILIYLYRQDSLGGMDTAKVRIDDDKIGPLIDGEYRAFLLAPGPHTLQASLLWMNFLPQSNNELNFTAKGGETVYLAIQVGYVLNKERVRESLPPGWNDERGELALFLKLMTEKQALLELRKMRRTDSR